MPWVSVALFTFPIRNQIFKGGIIEDMKKFETKIKDYQLPLRELIRDIGGIFGYVDDGM